MRRVSAIVLVLAALAASAFAWNVFVHPSVELRTVLAVGADARADLVVSDSDLARFGPVIERSSRHVEELFQRTFEVKPKIVLFANEASFQGGVATLFSYSDGVASFAASNYGGIFDRDTQTIAINLSALSGDGLAPTLDHELTHSLLREITRTRGLPAWFEEGLATVAESRPAGSVRWPEQDALIGRALAVTGRASFLQTSTLEGWHATYPRVGQALYSYAAAAVTLMSTRIGWPGVLRLLAAFAAGAEFADAYAATAGETTSAVEGRLQQLESALITRPTRSGDVEWTLATGMPVAQTKVTIAGASSYTVTFTVETDDLGIYRGTFGPTTPPGRYFIAAAGARAEIVTERR